VATVNILDIDIIMHHNSYQIDLPEKPEVVVFLNGIKALNFQGFIWFWQQIFQMRTIKAPGCINTILTICNHQEAVIISYWQDEASLMNFFHSPAHRQMMKNMSKIMKRDPKAISFFNEMYSPLRSGRYLNEPQGLAKIYPAIR